MDLRVPLVVLAACSSSSDKVRHAEDARKADAAAVVVAPDAAAVVVTPTTGDVAVRVEWSKPPRAAFVSPGANGCGTALAAQVSPSTTWGIGDVAVFFADARVAVSPPTEARVVAGRCRIEPRLVVGTSAMIASSADRPLGLTLARAFTAADLAATSAKPIAFSLPIAGHEVTTALEADAIYRVAATAAGDDAWIIAAPAVITDASGSVVIKDVAPGVHRVRAWLPPRGGQAARTASADVTVEVGELAELTLKLD